MSKAYLLALLLCFSNFAYKTMCLKCPPVKISLGVVKVFQTPPFEKGRIISLWKVSLFVGREFSCKCDNKPYFKFHIKERVFLTYRVMSMILGFLAWMTVCGATRIRRCFFGGGLCSAHRRVQRRRSLILNFFDICILQLAPIEVWRWVILLGSGK